MQKLNGFIKVHRQLKQWGWYKDTVVKAVFIHLLLTASFKDVEWKGLVIKSGQLVTSNKHLAEDLDLSIQQVRTALKKLQNTGEITCEATNKFTVITLVNWEKYQFYDNQATCETTNNQQTTNNQTTNNQQHRKNNKNNKECKEEKEIGASPDSSLSSSSDDWRKAASR